MVTLYDKNDEAIRTFYDVLEYNRYGVTYGDENRRGKIYANVDEGEYFDDPNNPLPLEPEIVLNPEFDEVYQAGADAAFKIIEQGEK